MASSKRKLRQQEAAREPARETESDETPEQYMERMRARWLAQIGRAGQK